MLLLEFLVCLNVAEDTKSFFICLLVTEGYIVFS